MDGCKKLTFVSIGEKLSCMYMRWWLAEKSGYKNTKKPSPKPPIVISSLNRENWLRGRNLKTIKEMMSQAKKGNRNRFNHSHELRSWTKTQKWLVVGPSIHVWIEATVWFMSKELYFSKQRPGLLFEPNFCDKLLVAMCEVCCCCCWEVNQMSREGTGRARHIILSSSPNLNNGGRWLS